MLVLTILVSRPQFSNGQTPPTLLTPNMIATQQADAEKLNGLFPGLILTPRTPVKTADNKYNQPYHAACYVYVGERDAASAPENISRYLLRFIIHAPEIDDLPLARRVARLLVLAYGENRTRLHFDHPYKEVVDIWLSRQGGQGRPADVGGEQFKNQIYIYSIYTERTPIEWAREVTHEYGHYALPGVSGFKEPEEWANGYLGERLSLKWFHDDLRSGVLTADSIPFVNAEQLNDYFYKQIDPLILRIAGHDTFDATAFARRDAYGMDTYTGLALYVDTVYGSSALLNAFAYTAPRAGTSFVDSSDFLNGVLASLRAATEFTITPLLNSKGAGRFQAYIPRGEWIVEPVGPIRSWEFRGESKGLHPISKNDLIVNLSNWQLLTMMRSKDSPPVLLHFRKKQAEIR